MSNKVKIHYLYHDGFAVETENHFLIFDYYIDTPKGEERSIENGVISKEDLEDRKKVLVFSSHSHHDHFNPLILQWEEYNKNIKYILSSDIFLENYNKNHLIAYENRELNMDGVRVKAFGSTDIGVSYYVEADGINIFHAGDLNWWHWKNDPMEEQADMELKFKSIINKLHNSVDNVDIAFFPVDYRLEEFFYLGGNYFINKIKPKLFIPMHYWENTYIVKDFIEKMEDINEAIPSQIALIRERGQVINFSKSV
ncbi:MBL fold metallo-hydrolase [Clostridium tetani]|uniref:MBL fold metallo-hydrolase n=1 Tax=Clostridium tetani TaxID=1513 RepID=A0ABY0ER99_CLOTA|nr:MBL fold metallo-hydrolase [Clostridium tetani]KHO40128.1 hydrolase [Clostridium tetani]RXI57593.1 MBL fold metallo-hydrolase [Clostridium tetani]RXI72312.1 MBL fold metallo-hydrolase [Clostridium tetani]CDI48513.1 metal dependent hydrolase [Clostridium tetani 12124569]